jgi:tagatose-6-phosphate ketose/aldose isomerase
MKYLGIEESELKSVRGFDTAKEIVQQPKIWQQVWDNIERDQSDIRGFFDDCLRDTKRIILTGAGTSAFIGISLRGVFQRETGIVTEAIPTTDLISHPGDYFQVVTPTLVISFARSGNSPESLAAVELADKICDTCYHFIITCNAEGKLANFTSKGRKYVFMLPQEANDKSLAMTSSYSSMLLSGLLVAQIKNLAATRPMLDAIVKSGEKIIQYYVKDIIEIARMDFSRAVFLGSGPNLGVATESHLKVQELTDGKVICKHDSFLGFRHGPKVVIDNKTLVFYIFSNDPHALKYEKDLVESMNKGERPLLEVGVMETEIPGLKLDYTFLFAESQGVLNEEFLSVCGVIPAQILGFFKSIELGLSPDSPSATGAITRVVEGVQIYNNTKL